VVLVLVHPLLWVSEGSLQVIELAQEVIELCPVSKRAVSEQEIGVVDTWDTEWCDPSARV